MTISGVIGRAAENVTIPKSLGWAKPLPAPCGRKIRSLTTSPRLLRFEAAMARATSYAASDSTNVVRIYALYASGCACVVARMTMHFFLSNV